MGTGDPLPAVKRQGREVDHSPPFNAEIKNSGALPTLPYVFRAYCLINLVRRQLLFYLFLMKNDSVKKTSRSIPVKYAKNVNSLTQSTGF
jgi:hypothetical protein